MTNTPSTPSRRRIAPTRWRSRCRKARCRMGSTGIRLKPITMCVCSPGKGKNDILIVGGGDHKTGEADDADARFLALEAWMRNLLPDLGKELHRWSGQIQDTIDYCGFIGFNPGEQAHLHCHR